MSDDDQLITILEIGVRGESSDVANGWMVRAIEVFEKHAEFSTTPVKSFLGRQVHALPITRVQNLLSVAKKTTAQDALSWYRQISSVNEASMRIVGKVHGLHVDRPHKLSNDFTFSPLWLMPPSPNTSALQQSSVGMPPGYTFPCLMYFEIENVQADEMLAGHEYFLQVVDEMRRTLNAFVLAGEGAPIITETWSEFVDDEMNKATGRSWQASSTDGMMPSRYAHMTDEALDWMERYLSTPSSVQNACDVALERLNIATRRLASGDKALDGCICLESVLSGKSRGELTHRLAVRTALLLGKDLEKRQKVAQRVREFYQLRSNMVHGSSKAKSDKSNAIAEDGLSLCREVISAIISHQTHPDPETWELTGGPPWNRLH